ncbi:MAG: AbrB/MazE/SpoVT family DNA-binding domain-containing protein [Nanoarchaeota archaeon]
MAEKIEMATVSSRGQVCIPNDIREDMGLKEGSKVLFMLTDGSLIMKKVNIRTFEEITKPLKEAARKAGMKESDVPGMVHRFREKKKAGK